MQQQLIRSLEEELEGIQEIADRHAADTAYTKQYFTIGRQAHVRSTQSFGTPALVWHVAFWPKQGKDPHDLDGKPAPKSSAARGAGDGGHNGSHGTAAHCGRSLTRAAARTTYDDLRTELAGDLDKLLERLQRKGRVPSEARRASEGFGQPKPPADWKRGSSQVPVKAFATESIAFTIWWSDETRQTCPPEPDEKDLRVRVQADIHPDFATITFIIDAGKPWSPGKPARRETHLVGKTAPASGTGDEDAIAESDQTVPGKRRRRIFHAARIVRQIVPNRLEQKPAEESKSAAGSEVPAERLLWASELLYSKIWEEFSKEFGCWLTDIAGNTDEVFANFRGVVLSAPGKPIGQGERPPHMSRFVYGARNGRGSLDEAYPNDVVKAYWPFIRRTRSEADHRDWIACGVFDWRAIYITALGGQSDFDPGDEHKEYTDPTLPRRWLKENAAEERHEALKRLSEIKSDDPAIGTRIERLEAALRTQPDAPETPQGDLPRPFHYLFLTSDEPNRRQIGRMVDRVNLLGTVRLYAMKDFSVVRDADVHLRIYGQLLDRIMSRATEETDKALEGWWDEVYRDARENLEALWGPGSEREIQGNDRLARLRGAYTTCVDGLKEEEKRFKSGSAPTERPLMHYRRLLADMCEAAPDGTKLGPKETNIYARAREFLNAARKAKSRHDEDMAQLNRQTDLRLHQIKTYIDALGRDAVGGLAFRINRARFYADMYRTMVKTLRVGSIDTWWDYEQLASRGVDPPLKFIENVGDRLEKLRTRLRDAMEAVQTSAIANQTEATRDNTYQLEAIARAISDIEIELADFTKTLEWRKYLMYGVYILIMISLAVLGAYITHSGALRSWFDWLRDSF